MPLPCNNPEHRHSQPSAFSEVSADWHGWSFHGYVTTTMLSASPIIIPRGQDCTAKPCKLSLRISLVHTKHLQTCAAPPKGLHSRCQTAERKSILCSPSKDCTEWQKTLVQAKPRKAVWQALSRGRLVRHTSRQLCCTSTYRFPIYALCLFSAHSTCTIPGNTTKASPENLPCRLASTTSTVSTSYSASPNLCSRTPRTIHLRAWLQMGAYQCPGTNMLDVASRLCYEQ